MAMHRLFTAVKKTSKNEHLSLKSQNSQFTNRFKNHILFNYYRHLTVASTSVTPIVQHVAQSFQGIKKMSFKGPSITENTAKYRHLQSNPICACLSNPPYQKTGPVPPVRLFTGGPALGMQNFRNYSVLNSTRALY